MDNDMYSLRVLAKGQVSDLSKGFNLAASRFRSMCVARAQRKWLPIRF